MSQICFIEKRVKQSRLSSKKIYNQVHTQVIYIYTQLKGMAQLYKEVQNVSLYCEVIYNDYYTMYKHHEYISHYTVLHNTA